MRLALCNEVLQPMPFAQQCDYAAKLGYDALEIAPFTLSEMPHKLTKAQRAETRRIAEDAGVPIIGAHWLLMAPKGLSITTPDATVRNWTIDVMKALIELSADLGARYMVHGSQRVVADGETVQTAFERARDAFAAIADTAAEHNQLYCIEPLAGDVTPVINTLAEAVSIVDYIGKPSVTAMLDCNHAAKMEGAPLEQVIDKWIDRIGHVHLCDRNRLGPGQGDERFAPVLRALRRNNYAGDASMEPTRYVPDGPGAAARSIGYIRGILETMA
jgi:sugar phosphate isomerase/epimerase